jgi:hypothetical protein
LAFAGLAFESRDAEAQRYYRYHPARPRARVGVMVFPRGIYFGGGLTATRILAQEGGSELLEDGAGLTLYSGLRVNQSLALELGWMGSLHNPERVQTAFGSDTDYLVLNAFTADAKVYVQRDAIEVQPFLQGGVGVYFLDSDYFGTQSVGTGFQLGGGVDFYTRSNVVLGLRALYRGMAMGPPSEDYNDTYVSAATVEGSLTFQF